MTRKAMAAVELWSTLVLLVLFVGVSPVYSADSRCADGQLAGGLHCACPDVVAEIAQGLITCPNGFVPVAVSARLSRSSSSFCSALGTGSTSSLPSRPSS
jgi:hypothetical protein